MRRRDEGSAVVEFTVFAIVALIPLAWAALSLQHLIAGHSATQTAAGEALRAFMSAPSEEQARARAQVAAELALGETAGMQLVRVEVACAAHPCLQPGAEVRVAVEVSAQLPAIPVLGVTPEMAVRAQQYGVVDAYVAPR